MVMFLHSMCVSISVLVSDCHYLFSSPRKFTSTCADHVQNITAVLIIIIKIRICYDSAVIMHSHACFTSSQVGELMSKKKALPPVAEP